MATLAKEEGSGKVWPFAVDALDEAILVEKGGGYLFSFLCASPETTKMKRLNALGSLFRFHKEGSV